MPVVSTTAEMSFSVLRRFNYYVRSPMKNDRLSSLGLMHINRDFEVDLYKAMEVFVSAKTRRADFSIVFIEG
jgi:translation elongation factor EF-G